MTLPKDKERLSEEQLSELPWPEPILKSLVLDEHPFAQYLGYELSEGNILAFYDGGKGQQTILLDRKGSIIADTTYSTKRVLEMTSQVINTLTPLVNTLLSSGDNYDYQYEEDYD